MENGIDKEVYFDLWCPKCRYRDKAEDESPCDECLNEPANTYSHKPVRYEKGETA